ncbi:unnamed protein product [Trichobilharzia szidati]|nr:unnamed protein product [Trichobilharzia szidati]
MSGDFNFPPSQDFELSVATSKPGGKNFGYSKPSLPVKQPMSAYVDFNPWYERWNRLSVDDKCELKDMAAFKSAW